MPLRVVLYAEGRGDLGVAGRLEPAPGSPLLAELFGPAHILLQRILTDRLNAGRSGVQFESPLRTGRGLEARGSMLMKPQILRGLLSWVRNAPDLAVVLVDEDGDAGRLSSMNAALAGRSSMCPAVIGVAVREFESWLITDLRAVRKVLEVRADSFGDVERMNPGDAKRELTSLMSTSDADRQFELRKRLSSEAELSTLRQGSRSFQRFEQDLRAALS